MAQCNDFKQLDVIQPRTPEGCEECLKSGDDWVHLRLCLECGHVGCCDDSPNRHATRHFHQTRHPVIQSFQPGETWLWCFKHQEMADFNRSFRKVEPRAAPGSAGYSQEPAYP